MVQGVFGGRFWAVWSAGAISYLGDGVVLGALPLLAASLTRDPRLVSLVDGVESLGWLLLGLVSGVVVDRSERLGLMWRIDVLRGLVMVGFAALVLTDHATVALLLAVSFLLGLAGPFFDNAANAALPELVDVDRLERANSLTQVSMNVMSNLIGPPLGALLFVVAAGAPLAVDAATFLVGALLVAQAARGRRRAVLPAHASRPLAVQVREGVGYLWSHRVLRTLSLAVAAVNGVTGAITSILVLFVLQVLHLPEAAFGGLIATFAVGGLVGAGLTPFVVRRLGQGTATGVSLAGFAVAATVLGVTTSTALIVAALALAGMMGLMWNVVTVSYRQRVVPNELLGRVTSAYRMISFAALPGGAVLAGLSAHVFGISMTYALGGVLLAISAALAIPALREMSDPVPGQVSA